MSSSSNPLLQRWERLSRLPGGAFLFSLMLGRMAPYTGTIRPRVLELRPGFCRVGMRDRRRVRNHLRSIHAIALMNLAEVTSGLAMLSGLPASSRAIVTGLSMRYRKKARGPLTAESSCRPPAADFRGELEIEAVVRDRSGDLVATLAARWTVGPKG